MRIGMLVTSIGNFGQKGFYNAQEIGLAKELDKLFEEVIVYKAVPATEKKSRDLIDGCEHSVLYQIPVRSRGIKWRMGLQRNGCYAGCAAVFLGYTAGRSEGVSMVLSA
ncbi:MAG: hypothetical protein PUG70_08755 [Lachnospiraceae bacterium]|nr:hypothetical protein [Lachnospiraceae bacterium]